MPNFPDSSGILEKERIRKGEFFSKIRDDYPKVSFQIKKVHQNVTQNRLPVCDTDAKYTYNSCIEIMPGLDVKFS